MSQDKTLANWLALYLNSVLMLSDVSIALYFVFHSLPLLAFYKRFDRSLDTILGCTLADELANKNMLELLLLVVFALEPLPKSQDRSRTAFSGQKASVPGFHDCRRLFLLDTPSLILLSITSFKLFL